MFSEFGKQLSFQKRSLEGYWTVDECTSTPEDVRLDGWRSRVVSQSHLTSNSSASSEQQVPPMPAPGWTGQGMGQSH